MFDRNSKLSNQFPRKKYIWPFQLDIEVCEFANENELPSRNSRFAIVHGAEAANDFVENSDVSKYDSGILWLRIVFPPTDHERFLKKIDFYWDVRENLKKYCYTKKILS